LPGRHRYLTPQRAFPTGAWILRAGGGIDAETAHFGTGAAKGWADAVFRDTGLAADFVIRLAFEMIEADDIRLFAVQFRQQAVNLVDVGQSIFSGCGVVFYMFKVAIAVVGNDASAKQFFDHDTAGNDREIGRQAALSAEAAEDGIVIGQDGGEDFGGKIFQIVGGNGDGAAVARVLDNVENQAEKAIDEIFPSPRLASETPLQELAIYVR
jgi:hypothetical protein